jgi:hypothetical protein
MKKERTPEEKAANEKKFAKEIEAREESKRKQLDREKRRIKKVNELYTRVTDSNDKNYRELIIRPHKFPRNLPIGFMIQSVFMIPMFLWLSMIVLPGEETLSVFLMWVLRVAFAAVFLLIFLYLVGGYRDMQTWRIRIIDGNFYLYGRNPDKPIAFGKRKDFSGSAWMKGDRLLCGVVDFSADRYTFRLYSFCRKDVETLTHFLRRV